MIEMEKIGKNLIELMEKKGISQIELSRKAGITQRQLWNIIHGKVKDVRYETLQKLARGLEVKVSDITGETEEIQREKKLIESQKEKIKKFLDQITEIEPVHKPLKPIPVYGRIPAGRPRETWNELVEDYINIPDAPDNAFALKVSGDSMIGAGIEDGDIVIIVPGGDVFNGDIVIALIDGSEFTLKRLIKQDNMVILQPANDNYKPILFTEEQARERLQILGVMIGIYRKIKRARSSDILQN